MPSIPDSPKPDTKLEDGSFRHGPQQGSACYEGFHIIMVGEVGVMMQMGRTISVATAQGQQFYSTQEEVIQPFRQAESAMDEIVGYRSVGHEAQSNQAHN